MRVFLNLYSFSFFFFFLLHPIALVCMAPNYIAPHGFLAASIPATLIFLFDCPSGMTVVACCRGARDLRAQ
ncbi:hypothetical protein CROQUDRAFT_242602 [Cronartium quercuum f. sp. fusiforme G11]|uniref:Uncharacterized protein n=1 Tax=Cronartium quercuum f. sp. fusiforme G11 TaxID=708437 RepID=A0A9P6N943_9BASI|nr:hypothetical protein CROQUDRAFT_242602 [Cronartium quercuum f. sp. fusiforme G11]